MKNDEMAEMIAERNGNQRFCKNCDDCCQPYNSTDDCFKSAMEAMDWKDEQYKELKKATQTLYESARKVAQLYEPLQLALNKVFWEINIKQEL